MRLQIEGLTELRERLDRLRLEDVMARAVAEQAEQIAEAVRQRLSEPPGAGAHDSPWLRSGDLRNSVGAQSDGLSATIGSSDPAAAPQEMGTARMPPRPFLAPVAAAGSEPAARAVAEAVVAALKGESDGDLVIKAAATIDSRSQGGYYDPLGVFVPGSPENEDWTRQTIHGIQSLGRELGHIFHAEQQPSAENDVSKPLAKPGDAVLSDDRRHHILDGEGRRGGHGPGRTNNPNKSKFPSTWSDEQALETIIAVANDPTSTRLPDVRGRTRVGGTRSGVEIRVIIENDGRSIVTAYPTNVSRGG